MFEKLKKRISKIEERHGSQNPPGPDVVEVVGVDREGRVADSFIIKVRRWINERANKSPNNKT